MTLETPQYESWNRARKVCVLGAGTMGAGIAAHLANIGFEVTLLDVSREAAEAGLDRAKKARPPHFYVSDRAGAIRLGGISENLGWVTEADWVCEAVVEKLDVKRNLFAALEDVLQPGAMISTNTSGLQISLLAQGRSESFRKRFMGTHFFNPPRYLKLLELIPTEETDPAAVNAMCVFLEERVSRRVVVAKDTPGFIANRYGMWSMFNAIHCAERLHLTVEQVDAITGPFLGRPRSGSFRLNDLVGLDIMQDIAQNLLDRCPTDPYRAALQTPASMRSLMGRGWIGDKSGHGYYRKEGKELLALDLGTFAYRNRQEPALSSIERLSKQPLGQRVREALELRDEVGEFLRSYLIPTLRYADYLKEEISHNVRDFDRVMMWGFGWEMGPFAMIDAIGADAVGLDVPPFYKGSTILTFDKEYISTTPEPEYSTVKEYPLISNGEAHNLRDLGDGVTAFCLTTKMGSITPKAVNELTALLESGKIQRLVLTSEAKVFSVGYDLNVFNDAIHEADHATILRELTALHRLGSLLEQIPSVAAVWGYALGAGLELAMSCSHIAANAECQIGLPEAKVGLIPGGRGTVLMRLRSQETPRKLSETAMLLTHGTVATNADQARDLGYLRRTDVTVYHPDRLITDAKTLALAATAHDLPQWSIPEGPIGGMIDKLEADAKAKGDLTDYDTLIGDKIKAVFVKSASYEDALAKEREEFLDLCSRPMTLTRIKHMLENGKPLRN
jgi:3-hydroxyacyl-CoA dehydrogenase